MKVHSQQLIDKIKDLRLKGMSIPEIMLLTGLAKTTIWHHVHTIELLPEYKLKISSNQGGSRKRFEIALESAQRKSIELLDSSHRDLCVIVGMLYWAEGSKRELVFTNTDIAMIRLYLHFLQAVLCVKEDDINLLIRISDPLIPRDVIKFWSENTKIPISRITINHDNIHNKTKSCFGICRVLVKKNSYYLKIIRCIIDAVKKEYAPIV